MFGDTNLISLAHSGGGGDLRRHGDGLPEQLDQAVSAAAAASESTLRHLPRSSHYSPLDELSAFLASSSHSQRYDLFFTASASDRSCKEGKKKKSSRGRREEGAIGVREWDFISIRIDRSICWEWGRIVLRGEQGVGGPRRRAGGGREPQAWFVASGGAVFWFCAPSRFCP